MSVSIKATSISNFFDLLENSGLKLRQEGSGQSGIHVASHLLDEDVNEAINPKKKGAVVSEDDIKDFATRANGILEKAVSVRLVKMPFESVTYATKDFPKDEQVYEVIVPIVVTVASKGSEPRDKHFGLKMAMSSAKRLLSDTTTKIGSVLDTEKLVFEHLLKNDTIDKNMILFKVA
jgi:hypothetical protein